MAKINHREQILNGNLGKAITTLTIPIVANSFIQTMYNLTDAEAALWAGADADAEPPEGGA